MKKIVFIFGTRPEFIKVYPIIKEFEKHKEYEIIKLNTGQHKEMLNELLNKFDVKVDYNLEIMDKSNGLTDILINSLQGIDDIIKSEKPDLVLVHGDTSATLAGSLGAFYNKVPLGHIEAGLRTYNKYSPYPEEINRQMTGTITDLHFTPTQTTENNLLKEGKNKEEIYVVGNSAIDMLKYTLKDDYTHEILDWVGDSKFILLTAHRRENLNGLSEIFEAIEQIAKNNKEYKIIFPVHLNPIIQDLSKEKLTQDNIKLVKPLETIDFHNIMNKAYFILTDSGGIQEEAPALSKPVLVLRDTTERPEGIEAGTLKLIGTNKENIIKEVEELINNKELYNKMANTKNPYGAGDTSEQIVQIVNKYLEKED